MSFTTVTLDRIEIVTRRSHFSGFPGMDVRSCRDPVWVSILSMSCPPGACRDLLNEEGSVDGRHRVEKDSVCPRVETLGP